MYTHSWAYQPSHSTYRTAWPTIVQDTRRIIEHVRRLGIVIAGPDGRRAPLLDQAEDIEFNGDATTDLAGGPFVLMAPLPSHPCGYPTATASCTTNRKPYDLAVTAVLLRATLLVPEAFAVASDARWDREWANGSPWWPAAAIRHGARRVVADLFDAHPAVSPLRDNVLDIRAATPATPVAAPPPVRQFQVDQSVHVRAFGNWCSGTVTKLGRTRVTVRYTRDVDGHSDERAFPTAQVHPADGITLVPVGQLTRGDVVVAVAGDDLTVAEVRQGPRRHRTVTYTNGSEGQLPAQTLIRVRT